MGHTLGMWHDCVFRNQFICNSRSKPRSMDGKDCYGYMDYDPKTNQWSHCNVADLTGVNKSCLKEITTSTCGNCKDVVGPFSSIIIITKIYMHSIYVYTLFLIGWYNKRGDQMPGDLSICV